MDTRNNMTGSDNPSTPKDDPNPPGGLTQADYDRKSETRTAQADDAASGGKTGVEDMRGENPKPMAEETEQPRGNSSPS